MLCVKSEVTGQDGHTKILHNVINKEIFPRTSGTTKVGEISKKVQDRRWYGHVMRIFESDDDGCGRKMEAEAYGQTV